MNRPQMCCNMSIETAADLQLSDWLFQGPICQVCIHEDGDQSSR